MKVIFLQEGYDPIPDPNSICTKALVDEFKRKGEDVYIICDGVKEKEHLFSKDKSIIHVEVNKTKLPYSKRGFWGKISRICNRVLFMSKWPVRYPQKIKQYVKVARNLISPLYHNEKEDIVLISVFRSAEMVEVGYQLKERFPKITWIIYNLDGIHFNILFKYKTWFIRAERQWQDKCYFLADYIIQMKSHEKVYIDSIFKKYLTKTDFLDIPLIININSTVDNVEKRIDKTLTFLYAGTFYRGLREPLYLLEWFKEIIKYKKISFHCYTEADFVEEIETVGKYSNGDLQRLDYISPSKIEEEMLKADCMISIGNKESTMIPSKIFVYMSACKPIIHFISDTNDSCLAYLRKYPLALIINQRESVEKSVKKTLLFLDKINEMRISFKEVETAFCENTPEYSINRILNRITL